MWSSGVRQPGGAWPGRSLGAPARRRPRPCPDGGLPLGFALLPGCGGQTSAVQGQQARSAWSRSWDTGWTSGDPGGLLPRTFRILSRCIFPSDLSLTRLFKRAEALRFAVVTFELLFQGAGPFLWHKQRTPISRGILMRCRGVVSLPPNPSPQGGRDFSGNPWAAFCLRLP